AAVDSVSENVFIADGQVFASVNQLRLDRTVKLFKSQTSPLEEKGFVWAYLFSIDDFEDDTTPIEYTNSTWSLNTVNGEIIPLGDGGGEYKTKEQIYDDYIEPELPFFKQINLGNNAFFVESLFTPDSQQLVFLGCKTRTPSASDGVYFGGANPFAFGANEARRAGGFQYREPSYDPNRQTFIDEFKVNSSEYTLRFETLGQRYAMESYSRNSSATYPKEFDYFYVYVHGNESGLITRELRYFRVHLTQPFNGNLSTWGSANYVLPANSNGSANSFVEGRNIRWTTQNRNAFIETAENFFRDWDQSGFAAPIFTGFSNAPSFHERIFNGSQLENGDSWQPFPHTSGSYGDSSARIYSATYTVSTDSDGNSIRLTSDRHPLYRADLYEIPVLGKRNPGIKNIYCQVRDNKKTLVHQIPSFEHWDGYISPLQNGSIEVILCCGKKYDPNITNYQVYLSGFNYSGDPLDRPSVFDREWAQIRVYNINSNGLIISTEIYNNSQTELNPTEIPDEIVVDPSNWQKQWLETYEDWRTRTFRYEDIPSGELNFVAIDLATRIGRPEDLNTAYRSFFGQRIAYQNKVAYSPVYASPGEFHNYGTNRILVDNIGTATLTNSGLVSVNPEDLFNPAVQFDLSYTFSTLFFPNQNYSIFSGLYQQRQTNKVFYLTNAEYSNGELINQVSIKKTTTFPKLDLTDELALGLALPDEISISDWDTEWSTEPGVETSVLRFGFKAIAFLG
ncbi:MAG: hypothetical protein AAGF26_14450, partial [Cyanobacteria bacterium P01_G01_bin.49]